MKFSQIRRITQATVLSLAIGLGMSACSEDYTIDYLYVTSSRALSSSSPDGGISAYKIDNQSGSLTQIVDSPYDSGGRNPIAMAVSPNSQAIYVINNLDTNIVEFLIGTDGKIYPKNVYNLGPTATEGSLPTSAVIDPTGKYLIVTFTYQHGYPIGGVGPGGVAVFPINSDNSLGSPVVSGTNPYFLAGNTPVAVGTSPLAQAWKSATIYTVNQTIFDGTNVEIATVAGTSGSGSPSWSSTVGGTTTDGSVTWKNVSPIYSFVYVIDQEPGAGTILGYLLSAASGSPTLTSLPGTTNTTTVHTGYPAGVIPYAIAEDPTGRFVYVTDESSNQLIGYVVQATGALTPMLNGPFGASLKPEGIAIDPRGKYLYVTNYNSSTVSGYAIDSSTGQPSGVFSNGTTTTGTGPDCVTIEPAQGIYLYTSNYVDNSVSGMQLDAHTGALVNVQNTPFNSSAQPTCAATVASAGHAYQAVQP